MWKAITAALLAVLVQGCTAARPTPPHAPRDLPTAAQLLAGLDHRRAELHGVRAMSRLRYSSPNGTENARNALAVQRPDRLRIEVLSVLGSMFVLTSGDGVFSAYVPRESTVYRGTASPTNLAPYLPVGISVPVIVDHLLATPSLGAEVPSVVEWDEGRIRLTQADADGTRTVWFRDVETPSNYRETDPDGRTTFEVSYAEVDDSTPVPLPRRVTVRLPLTNESVEITMRDPEINPSFSAGYFFMNAPAEARQVDLDAAQF